MKKRIRNPQRSLEMVVDAPLQECIHALGRLDNSGGKYTQEFVDLQVNQLDENNAEFTLKLERINGKSRIITALRGTMHHDLNYETTTVVGEIAPIHSRVLFGVVCLGGIALFLLLSSTGLKPQEWALVIFCIIGIPFYFWLSYQDDQNDTQRVLQMATRELNGAAYRHRQRALKSSKDESPFYGD